MQMYAGLPIITNKITPEEARGVPHHLLGVLDARDAWQVGMFVSEAGRIVGLILWLFLRFSGGVIGLADWAWRLWVDS